MPATRAKQRESENFRLEVIYLQSPAQGWKNDARIADLIQRGRVPECRRTEDHAMTPWNRRKIVVAERR